MRVSIAVKRHHGHINYYKEKRLTEVKGYSFRDLVHYHHSGQHRSLQADKLLEKRGNMLIWKQQEVNCVLGVA